MLFQKESVPPWIQGMYQLMLSLMLDDNSMQLDCVQLLTNADFIISENFDNFRWGTDLISI